MAFSEFWRSGGFAMYPIALLGLLSLLLVPVLGLSSLLAKRSRGLALSVSTALIALGLLIVLTGFIGYQHGVSQTEAAVASVDPVDKATILAQGTSEARACLTFGVAASLPSLVAGVALFGLGLARLERYRGAQVQITGG